MATADESKKDQAPPAAPPAPPAAPAKPKPAPRIRVRATQPGTSAEPSPAWGKPGSPPMMHVYRVAGDEFEVEERHFSDVWMVRIKGE